MKRFGFWKNENEESNKGEEKGLVPFGGFGLGFSKEPALEVYEKDNKVVVKAELPGLDKKDIKLSLDGNILTISGKRSAEREVKKDDYYYTERSYGNIQRSVRIPEGVKQDGVKASYKDGILAVEFELDKAAQKGRDIEVE